MTLSQHRDARGQPRKVGVLGSHVGRRLGGELVELVGRDAVVDALDDLLGEDLRRAFVRPLDAVRTASKSKKKPALTSSDGDDAHRWRKEGH